MITQEQVSVLAKKYRINETVIFREYLQLVFLQKLYQKTFSQNIFFKGGTAIHLIYQAPRFSEDLDFSIMSTMPEFDAYITTILKRMEDEEGITWKERKSVAGKQFLLAAENILPYKTYIALDFSFREKIFSNDRSIIQTAYPVLFTSYVYHLSQEEVLAEKIRAVMTRKKGRDLYDLWFLLSKGTEVRQNILRKKLAYYEISEVSNSAIIERVASFSKKDFVLDLRPFVPLNERDRLSEFFDILQVQIKQAFTRIKNE
ncbi:MAG: nucleotidyl transferase AbiEii/AbiGii toxin family protein [Chloroflexi bacterium]|nr:nucleotidyl transferase AbiEii/AbiGii toxin family protein [Chloroflexota bacterium]